MNISPMTSHTKPLPHQTVKKTESDSNTINKTIRINTDEEGEGQVRRESKRKRLRDIR